LEKHPDRVRATARSAVKVYFIASIVLHLALVLLWAVTEFMLPAAGTPEWEQQEATNLAFELIEVPDYIPQEPPEAETNLVSDRETSAADMNPETPELSDKPYTEGPLEFEQYEQPDGDDAPLDRQPSPEADDTPPDRQPSPEVETEPDLAQLVIPESGIDYMEEMSVGQPGGSSRKSAASRKLAAGAEKQGGISFNTYNWDFAPYMLAMKRKVESHMRPPYAFTHMGAVSGTNIIRFVVLPNGSIRDLEILDSDTHSSLDLTSLRAIELSVPFLPLPRNFPEDYLEVTAHFAYIIDR
jgi:hypothetical protein